MAPTKAAAVSTKTPATKKPKTHPPYSDMVKEAIVALKERTGSSQYAIAKHIEDNHKDLPANFKKMLLVQLKKLVAAGKLTKVKNSFKLAATVKSAPAKAPAKAKAKAPAAKSASQVKAKKVIAKAKVKTPVKGKKGVKAPVKKPKSIKSPVKKVAVKKVKK